MAPDPYAVLGVRRGASAEEVRRAYLALARRHHPDAHAEGGAAARAASERRMQEVNAAWAVLGDPGRRAAFDRDRGERDGGGRPAAGPDPGFRPFDPGPDPDPADAPDVPYRPAAPPSGTARAARLAPALLFVLSVAAFSAAAVLASGPLAALAVVLLVGSGVGFVVLPLLALSAARRDEG
jgi:curved DNA-binding protein CbpA